MGIGRFLGRFRLGAFCRFMPFIAILLYVADIARHPDAAFWTHNLSDPDDYMRLNEVVNWLQGQSWYDLGQPRLSPGMHTVIHWSRLVDVPIALLTLGLTCFMNMQDAVMVAAMIVPPVLFLLLVALVPAIARPLLGKRHAYLALTILPLTPSIIFNFTPGRVDHHAYSIMIAGFGLMALQHMLLCRGGWRSGAIAGVFFACGLWIGTEIMPALMLVAGSLALFAAWRGGFALRNAAVFGGALALASVIILPIALPVSAWGDLSISWFSAAAMIFSALTAMVFILAWVGGRHQQKAWLRLALMAGAGGLAALIFVGLVPEVLAGPFADYYRFNATAELDNIVEALPILQKLIFNPHNPFSILAAIATFIDKMWTPLLALSVCLYMACKAQSRTRQLWIIYAIFLAATLLLALFCQNRITNFLNLYRFAPLAFLVFGLWRVVGRDWPTKKRVYAALIAFILIGPLPMLLPIYLSWQITKPMVGEEKPVVETCNLRPVTDYLAKSDTPHVIMAPMDDGPELLFRTPHSVIGAHYNVAGNQNVSDFFKARDDVTAKAILSHWRADIVLACRRISPFYAGREHIKLGENTFLSTGRDGKLHLVSSLTNPTLIERLVDNAPPAWLKPVEIAGNKDYLVYQVLKNESAPQDEPHK